FLVNTRPAPFRWMVLAAFTFSWIGDLFLMFAWKSDLCFFAGVGGFFVSQLFYILTFLYYGQGHGQGLIARRPALMLPFLIYLAVIYLLVRPGLEGVMKPVVLVYAVSLIGMAIAALNRWGLTQWRRFWLTFAGALLFVFSDSLLAYTRFISEVPKDAFIIMVSYISAQYLIMRGILKS
ncbi:MAG: lysoplasmalogenase, partial [Bacteroidales bacterium]